MAACLRQAASATCTAFVHASCEKICPGWLVSAEIVMAGAPPTDTSATMLERITPTASPGCSQSQNWRTWSGYFVASSYDVMHDYEYHAVRNTAALIDICPLYKYEIRGKDALRLVNRVITRDAAKCAVGQALYGCLCEVISIPLSSRRSFT